MGTLIGPAILPALNVDAVSTPNGTTGARTIDKPCGTVNFASGTTSLVVTNQLVTSSSKVFCMLQTNDQALITAVLKCVVPANGSFTIYLTAAPLGEVRVAFLVVN